MEREPFGLKELDSMIQGGIPKGAIAGLSGPPGVGKSMFSLHFLLEGAKRGQKCLYINLEEPRSNIDNMLKTLKFGDQFLKLESKGLIKIKCMSYPEYERIFIDLYQKISEDPDLRRIVIDSFNVFFLSALNPEAMDIGQEINIRKMITQAFSFVKKKNLTSLLVLEKHTGKENSFQYNIPYLVDGMINLDFLELGTIERRIFIPKMRWTDQYRDSKVYEISNNGIDILEE